MKRSAFTPTTEDDVEQEWMEWYEKPAYDAERREMGPRWSRLWQLDRMTRDLWVMNRVPGLDGKTIGFPLLPE